VLLLLLLRAGRAVLEQYDLPVFECPLHLEGGSIHSDGQG
jgi:agmatine deiminase